MISEAGQLVHYCSYGLAEYVLAAVAFSRVFQNFSRCVRNLENL
jgi:hypothetical protein